MNKQDVVFFLCCITFYFSVIMKSVAQSRLNSVLHVAHQSCFVFLYSSAIKHCSEVHSESSCFFFFEHGNKGRCSDNMCVACSFSSASSDHNRAPVSAAAQVFLRGFFMLLVASCFSLLSCIQAHVCDFFSFLLLRFMCSIDLCSLWSSKRLVIAEVKVNWEAFQNCFHIMLLVK